MKMSQDELKLNTSFFSVSREGKEDVKFKKET